MRKKVTLCILDGWGISPDSSFNGIHSAKNWPKILQNHPHTQLQASENYVGLPAGQMGNSEVGHMTIGLGRVLMQDLPKIDQAFKSDAIKKNQRVLQTIEKLKASGKPCHLLGLLSPGGVHSHMDHIRKAAYILANAGITVHIHCFLDGRDTPPKSALDYVRSFFETIKDNEHIHLSSLGGRYYGMDRDNRWDRTELAYNAIVNSLAPQFSDPTTAIESSYQNGVTDEFIIPSVHKDYQGMADGDGLWMINFRSDRVRQVLRSLLCENFTNFSRKRVVGFGPTLAMNEYATDLNPLIPSIFEKDQVNQSLGEVIAEQGLKQLRVAETEKYAHVTFFLNGGKETPFEGEERVMIPSPKVATYDLDPKMSASKVTDSVVEGLKRGDLDLIVVNYANTDMVGHTGVIDAINNAVEYVDACVEILVQTAIKYGWTLIITADHGNAECMRENDGINPHTAHTCNPVPFVLINGEGNHSLREGTLADVAPTILQIMGIAQPNAMTGRSLLC